LIAAYAGFAKGGSRIQPHLISRIEDRDGQVLWQAAPQRDQGMDPANAFGLTPMLRAVVGGGPGSAARAGGFRGAAAANARTADDASDVWFIGYTPDLVGGL